MTSNVTARPNIGMQVYAAFKDSGVTPSLVTVFGCKAFVSLIGVLLNLDLILITARTKTLRGVCNLLIASSALSITVQNFSCFVTFFVIISGANFIPLKICGFLQFFPLFFACFTNVIALAIGLDRLFSILFPVWHMNNNQNRIYFLLNICACSLLYSGFIPIVGLWTSLNNPNIPVMCTVIDPVQAGVSLSNIIQLSTNCSSITCYLLVWVVIWMKQSSSNAIKKKQLNIFKSLSVILLLEISGWFANYTLRIALGDFQLDETFKTWYIIQAATVLPYLTISISPVGLYMFSSDYRRAFLQHLPQFLKPDINSVQAISMNTNNQALFVKRINNNSHLLSVTQHNVRKMTI